MSIPPSAIERDRQVFIAAAPQVAGTGGRSGRWLIALALVGVAALGTVGYAGWRQPLEDRPRLQERVRQERERIAAEAPRPAARPIEQGEELNAAGVLAFRRGAHARAVVLYEAALELMDGQPAQVPAQLRTRMNRAAALRELGLVEPARDELLKLLPLIDQSPATGAYTKGRTRYHLALCQWRLGNRSEAERAAEQSLAAYDGAPGTEPIDPGLRQQSEILLEDVKNGLPPLPLAAIDAPAALEAARAHYRASRETPGLVPAAEQADRPTRR